MHYFRVLAALLIVTLCCAANLSATAVQMQAVTTVIFPANSVRPDCPMHSANGGLTTTYSTPAAENNTFVFDDFLPPTAILSNVGISLSLLGDGCPNPNPIAVYLNQGFPGVAPDMTIGTDYAGGDSTPNCQTPGQFEEIGRMGPSMLNPDVAPYVRNGPNAITVVEQPNGSCSQFVEYVVVYLVYYDSNDLPLISFDLSAASSEDERKVLMHRWRSEAAYPYLSSFQVAAAQNDAGRDGHIQINATVTDASGTPLPGMYLFVRVVDPPDPSTYLPPAESHWGDNPWGWHTFLIPYAPEPNYGWQPVTSDGNGRISLPLQVGAQGNPSIAMPAGDNVQIQASAIFLPFVSPTRCTPALGCYMSGVITSWRRVYIERDRMFRAGAFLINDGLHGATTLDVTDISAFRNASASSPIPAILIHGDSPTAAPPHNYMETVYVKKAAGGKLTLTQVLRYDYFAVRSSIDRTLFAGDAIGKYANDADLFPTDLGLAINVFGAKTCQNPPTCDSLYTDFMVIAEGSAAPNPPAVPNMVPYIPFISSCTPTLAYCVEVAERFFDSRNGRQTRPGHQHFISSAADSIDIQNWSAALGNTCKDADTICGANNRAAGTILIWNGAIEKWSGLSPLMTALQEVSAHELAHTFDVNQATGDYGHCTAQPPQPGGPMASNQTGHCLMNNNRTNDERTDGRIGFHVSPWDTSEYRRIRARPDPIPQTWQPTFLPNP